MSVQLAYRSPAVTGVALPAVSAPFMRTPGATGRCGLSRVAVIVFGAFVGMAVLMAALGLGTRDAHGGGGPACAERSHVIAQLADHFSEVPVFRGLGVDGRMMEIYAAPGGSWSIAFTRPNGQTCVTASGDAFDLLGVPGFAWAEPADTTEPAGTL